MGKLQFHRKVEKDSKQKDKTFSLKRETEITIICFMKLKQFVERRTSIKISSSEQEHKVNALASGAEEGRDKLR